mmetsp:Transcript_8804/g.12764  ORF Transcript_8804/g.12764 Transcript_8804/m.12764 type:complete len:131 (+) Transcript_8804:814-1206(+)
MERTLLGVCAASMVTKEIVTCAIIGNIWENTEFGDAAEIRVARHLGQGRGAMSKLSAYKSSMFLAMMGSYWGLPSVSSFWFRAFSPIFYTQCHFTRVGCVVLATTLYGIFAHDLLGTFRGTLSVRRVVTI